MRILWILPGVEETYGCNKKKAASNQMLLFHRILTIPCVEHITNGEVVER